MSKRKEPGSYEIGYRKPPSATQFKPGQSGNPSGRPKGSVDHRQMVLRIARERVTVVEHGRKRSYTKLELAVKQQMNKAAQGDLQALDMIYRLLPAEDVSTVVPDFTIEDEAILANLLKRSTPKSKSSPRRRKSKRKSK